MIDNDFNLFIYRRMKRRKKRSRQERRNNENDGLQTMMNLILK